MSSLNVLITGINGFLGKHLSNAFIHAGHNVSGLSRRNVVSTKIQLQQGDLLKVDNNLQKAFKGKDIVVDSSVDYKNPLNNIIMIKNIIDQCYKYKIKKLVYISSQNVSFVKSDSYSKVKLECEQLIKKSSLQWVILRPTLVYDNHGGYFIGQLVQKAKKYKLIVLPGNGSSMIQPIHAKNIADYVLYSLGQPFGTTITLAGRQVVSLNELAQSIQKHVNGSYLVRIPLGVLKFVSIFSKNLEEKIVQLDEKKVLNKQQNNTLENILKKQWHSVIEDIPLLVDNAH